MLSFCPCLEYLPLQVGFWAGFASRNFYVRNLEVDVTRQETAMVLVYYPSYPGAGSWATSHAVDLLILCDVWCIGWLVS